MQAVSPSPAMDFATSNDNERYGHRVEDRVENRRKSSAVAAGRRKSSAVGGDGEEAVAIVEGAQLSGEDRRLAEMGYVQVSHHFPQLLPTNAHPSDPSM